MTVLTANEALRVLLTGVKEPAEIRDPDGNLLGYFTLPGQEEDLLYERQKRRLTWKKLNVAVRRDARDILLNK